jgi:hypothetical protein
VLRPRRGKFDSNLVEPGPPAILRDDGILFIYNSKNVICENEVNSVCVNGESDTELAPGTYSAGQALFSRTDPTQLLRRSDENFFKPTEEFEITGQVGNVCFLEGMVYFKDKWLMYYGTADSKIAVAQASDYDHTGKKDPRKRGSSAKKPMFQPVRENFSPEEVSNRAYQTQRRNAAASSGTSDTIAKKVPAAPETRKSPDVASSNVDLDAAKPLAGSVSSLHPADVSDVTSGVDTESSSDSKVSSNVDPEKKSVEEGTPLNEANLRKDNAGSKKAKRSKKKRASSDKSPDEDNFML